MNYQISERRIRNNKARRRRQLRHHILLLMTTLLLTTCFSFCFFSFKTKAQTETEQIAYKYYKSIVVESGDTIWDYAKEYAHKDYYESYESYIKEVIRINKMQDDSIQSGQYLIIPYYSYEFVS